MKIGEKVYVDLGGAGTSELTYVRSRCKCSDRHPCRNAERIFKHHNGKEISLRLRDWPELREVFNI